MPEVDPVLVAEFADRVQYPYGLHDHQAALTKNDSRRVVIMNSGDDEVSIGHHLAKCIKSFFGMLLLFWCHKLCRVREANDQAEPSQEKLRP